MFVPQSTISCEPDSIEFLKLLNSDTFSDTLELETKELMELLICLGNLTENQVQTGLTLPQTWDFLDKLARCFAQTYPNKDKLYQELQVPGRPILSEKQNPPSASVQAFSYELKPAALLRFKGALREKNLLKTDKSARIAESIRDIFIFFVKIHFKSISLKPQKNRQAKL